MAYQFESEAVPLCWFQRSEEVIATLCSAFISPDWGAVGVDVTEMLLTFTFHNRALCWPSGEALAETKRFIESKASGLYAKQLQQYPDIPIGEDLFVRLPLWDEADCRDLAGAPKDEHLDSLKRFIFRILALFEVDGKPRPLIALDTSRSEGATVSARRMFMYLALAGTPVDGLQRALQLRTPPLKVAAQVDGEEHCPKLQLKDLWSILYSTHRPKGVAVPASNYDDFCEQFRIQNEQQEELPEGEEPPPPSPVEAVNYNEQELLRHPAVLQALSSHGGVLCRNRGTASLFPTVSSGLSVIHSATQVPGARGFESLIPKPPEIPSGEGDVQQEEG